METLDKIEYPFSFRWGQEIKFIDGKGNEKINKFIAWADLSSDVEEDVQPRGEMSYLCAAVCYTRNV